MKLLLVEDDDRVAAAQELVLHRHGIGVVRAATAAQCLQSLHPDPGRFDVIVLDLGLPDADGLTLCRGIRALTDTPIIISSARADLNTRLAALHTAADDYLVKPYDLRELIAKVHVLTRRRSGSAAAGTGHAAGAPGAITSAVTGSITGVVVDVVVGAMSPPRRAPTAPRTTVVRVGPVELDHATRVLHVDGAPVILTVKEFDLVALLATAPGMVFRRDQITAVVWGARTAGVDHSLDVLIARIRRRTGLPDLIGTVRGVGYHLGPRIHASARGSPHPAHL